MYSPKLQIFSLGSVLGKIILKGVVQSLGVPLKMRGCTWSKLTLRQVVHVKVTFT